MEQIIVKHIDGSSTLLISRGRASSVTKAEQRVALLGDDLVNITLESATPIMFAVGDKLVAFGRTYKLNLLPTIKKTGQRKFSYELTFEGPQYDLLDVTFLLPDDTTGDSFTGTLKELASLIITNALRVFPGKWKLGDCPEDTDYKTLSYVGENCLNVAQNVCKEYGIEFEIEPDGETYTLHFRKAGTDFPYTFRYGKTGGLYELTRKKIDSKNVITRLYVYGGSSNLGSNYRYSKLCLPGKNKNYSYLENKEAIEKYGLRESVQNYEEIFPNRYGEVTAKGSKYYAFVDSSMNFDLNEKDSAGNTKWLIADVAAKVKFTTGNLAGYEFEIHKYDHATKTIEVVPFTDETGMKFPSETSAAFQFAEGDKYFFTDINLPDTYKTEAENKLSEEGAKTLEDVCQPKAEYSLSIDQNFIKQFAGELTVVNLFVAGDYITVEDEDLGINKAVRITEFTRDLLQPYSYSITLGDAVTQSTYTRVVGDLEDIKDIIKENNLADPSNARRNWRASQEVLAMVFDPEGDYYSSKIKPLSIETSMLAVGAKSMQFVLRNVVFQPNYEGNPNYIKISGGTLVHYTIAETIKSWTLAAVSYSNLVSGTAYYIYAKCQKAGNTGSIILTTEQKTVDSDPMDYYFLVGVLNSVETDDGGKNPARLVSLTYGSSTVSGRFIKTGRIESSGGGKAYFDLDKGEIGGNIKFVSSDGSMKNVADLDDISQEAKDYIDNTLPGVLEGFEKDMKGLTNQIDGKIESWFQTSDPATAWNTTALKKAHVGDMWYNSNAKKLKRYSSSYTWANIDDQDAINAYTAASKAQDTADGKRRVFVSTPKPPYDIGDLWLTGGKNDGVLKRCATARSSGSYVANDWVEAVYYDNTKTTIDGGIVTSGTVQLAGTNGSILAGITGEGTASSSVRIWAGASKDNRANAPFRVLQDGSFVATKAVITGEANINKGTIGGFEIASGRIGVAESSSMGGSNQGLSILSSFIKYSKTGIWTGFGTNVMPASSGMLGLCRLEYDGSSYNSGIGLYIKFRPVNNSTWYTQRAIQIDGNSYLKGGFCLFEDVYRGQAYSDIIESYIGIAHSYVFSYIGASYLAVRLPTASQIQAAAGTSQVTFLLQIQVGYLGNGNKIRVQGQSGCYLCDNNCNHPNGGYGSVDMAQGDSLLLRYNNGDYYIVQYRT